MTWMGNRRDFLADAGRAMAGTWLGVRALANRAMGAGRDKPSVLFIMTDQQRTDTLRCYGNPLVETPSLDRLASEGVRFDSCYATQPVCSPCRSSMVTGLFPHATGVIDNSIPLNPELFAYPRAMREAGYRTCYIGKWHLGTDPVPPYFDDWHGYETGWPHWIEKTGQYRPDEETDYAIEFIRKSRETPFLCWLAFYPPHTPKTAPEENLALYRNRIEPHDQAVYHAMVNRLDWNIGRLMDALDEMGLREKTLVVFTSDHGENFPNRWNDHLKRLCYDQSACVPLLLSWRGVLGENRVCPHVFSMADLPLTIMDLCGIKTPDGLHGDSARGLLEGKAEGWHDSILVQNRPYRWDHREHAEMWERCLITDRWKLILNTEREPEMYDRKSDREDRTNLYRNEEVRHILPEMGNRLLAWGEKTGDELAARLVRQWLG